MTDDRPRGTILIVDDNVEIRKLAKTLLETAGYAVITAADGEEGLHSYEKHRSTIVLLLTDVLMPKIGGFDLAERVLRMDSQLPIVVMSGEGGCDDRGLEYLAKPFRTTDLIETVCRVLSAKARSHQTAAQRAF